MAFPPHDDRDEPESAAAAELRSYGRRRGRKLSPRQDRLIRELLPRISLPLATPPPKPLAPALFSQTDTTDLWLEIGFGGGEHLLWQARRNPHIGIIGAEPFEDGVVKVLAAIDEGLANVRVHADDARAVLRWLPDRSLGRVFILFPDPWPKRRHVKRRLINEHLLRLLARVMRPGAELRIGTDIGDYARTILMAFATCPQFVWQARSPADWRERPADWPETRYEQKAHREGRRCAYLRFIRAAK